MVTAWTDPWPCTVTVPPSQWPQCPQLPPHPIQSSKCQPITCAPSQSLRRGSQTLQAQQLAPSGDGLEFGLLCSALRAALPGRCFCVCGVWCVCVCARASVSSVGGRSLTGVGGGVWVGACVNDVRRALAVPLLASPSPPPSSIIIITTAATTIDEPWRRAFLHPVLAKSPLP